MRTLVNRLKDGLERLGYEFNQDGQFSVELADNAIVVSEKIDMSPITKEKDNLNILLFVHEPRIGGPVQVNRLSVSVNRQPINNNTTLLQPPKVLLKQDYVAEQGKIPSKAELLEMVSGKLNISSNHILELITKKEIQYNKDKQMYKPFLK